MEYTKQKDEEDKKQREELLAMETEQINIQQEELRLKNRKL